MSNSYAAPTGEYQKPSGGYQVPDPTAPTLPEALMEKDVSGDSLMENVVEFGDPTGIASYDDVFRAYQEFQNGDGTALNLMMEAVGALPIIGKIKYLEKTLPTWMWTNGIARPVGDAWNKAASGIEQMYGGPRGKSVVQFMNRADAVQDMDEDNLNIIQKK